MKFAKLTKTNMRKLQPGYSIVENGIVYEKLLDGDGKFRIEMRIDGQRVKRVVGKESEGITKEAVIDIIFHFRMESRTNKLNLPANRKTHATLAEIGEMYLSRLQDSGGRNLSEKTRHLNKALLPILGHKSLSRLSTHDIDMFKKKRAQTGVKPSTINRELETLSHVISQAVEWGWINQRPCRIVHLRENNGRIIYLTHEQINRLLEVAKQDPNRHIYLFIMIGIQTGMRAGEIMSIEKANIDLAREFIYIPQAKAGAREQPITPLLKQILADHLSKPAYQGQWLFPSPLGMGHIQDIRRPFKRVVKAAGLCPKQVVRHTLRHTAITHLVQSGIDLLTVKRISGHRTLAMVERYAHQSGDHIKAAMSKLEAHYRLSPNCPQDQGQNFEN